MTSSRLLKIFLSHASGDKPEIEKLNTFLSDQGADPWLDSEKLLPGQDWNFEIRKALDESHVILVCLSKKSVSKEGYVQKEIRIALDLALEMPEGRIFLIPARLEECDLPYSLRPYQWVDLFTTSGMDRLVKSLNLRAQQVGARPLSADAANLPEIKKPTPAKKPRSKPSAGNVINIQGNVTGSTIVIGDDNKVDTD
jgi:hypothetical protein